MLFSIAKNTYKFNLVSEANQTGDMDNRLETVTCIYLFIVYTLHTLIYVKLRQQHVVKLIHFSL